MRHPRLALALLATTLLLAGPVSGGVAPGVGTRLDSLAVGAKTFEEVTVRSVTPRSITFTHRGGMASALLRELAPDLQEKFGYDAAADQQAEARLAEQREAAAARERQRSDLRSLQREQSLADRYERLLQEIGAPPMVHREVDLRPRFRELGLGVKDQGRRPSCSVFAVVSALEYQNARLAGRPEKLSEEYLLWALRRSTRRVELARANTDVLTSEVDETTGDAGFTLPETVGALRAFGIPLQEAMPNTFGVGMHAIADPSEELIAQARSRRKFFIHFISPRDTEAQLACLVNALNAEVPVPIGVRWPHETTVRTGYLSQQKPVRDSAHAVTLVGYRCDTGQLKDAVFIFKNSYGPQWGQAGYGLATFGYLKENLLGAILLEVQRGET